MNVGDVDLLKLQTRAMQTNTDVIGFSKSLNAQFRDLAEEINNVLIYGRIDQLPEDVLDILAWQLNVLWYDATSPIEVKRQAINDALLVARTLGTPAAIEKVIEIYFGDGRVEEWFEYGSDPYYFRVVTNNPSATGELAALLIRAVNQVKNLRSRLESVIIESVETLDLKYGFVLQMTDNLTIKQVV